MTRRGDGATGLVRLAEAFDVRSFGPKAATLGALAAAGMPVPEGFVIGVGAYERHAQAAGIPSLASTLTTAGTGDLETTTCLASIRAAILHTPVPDDLAADVLAHLERIGGAPVAVRSSATAEDLPSHSFAGQHGTYFVGDGQACLRAVADCWASLWTEHAWRYRERAAIHQAGMCVIVQHLVLPDAAGVAFTADPVSGDRRAVLVESVLGLGEALVSGKATPDRFVIDRDTLEEREREIARKDLSIVFEPGTGAVESPVAGPASTEPSLRPGIASRIAELALAAERAIEAPADVEWAVAGDEVFLLQARPITTGPPDGGPPLVWSNANTGEVLPDVVTPMTWSMVRNVADGLIRTTFGMIGLDLTGCELTRLIGGRAYFNVTVLHAAFRQVPGFGGEVDFATLLGGMPSEEGSRALRDRPVPEVELPTWKLLLAIPRTVVWVMRNSGSRAERFTTAMRAGTTAGLAELDRVRDDPHAVTDLALRLAEGLIDLSEAISFAVSSMTGVTELTAATRRWLGDTDGSIANGLLVGRGDVGSADAGLAILELASLAGSSRVVRRIVETGGEWERVRGTLETAAAGGGAASSFLDAWDAFMAEHGHHCRGELELSNPRWDERPDLVLTAVRSMLSAPDGSEAVDLYRRRASRAQELARECRERLSGPVRRALFEHALREASRGIPIRENVKNEGVRRIAAVRRCLLAVGEHLRKRGVFRRADDVFFVSLEELGPIADGQPPFVVPDTVAARRAEHDRDVSLHPPPVIIGEWRPGATPAATITPSETMTGLGVSPGSATGPARVIASVEEDATVLPGEILVAPFTDPGWTPYFLPAAGIVVDMGGLMSHGSIIAREYGIPAVVNVGPATTFIRTGQIVTVDGSAGTVSVHPDEG